MLQNNFPAGQEAAMPWANALQSAQPGGGNALQSAFQASAQSPTAQAQMNSGQPSFIAPMLTNNFSQPGFQNGAPVQKPQGQPQGQPFDYEAAKAQHGAQRAKEMQQQQGQ